MTTLNLMTAPAPSTAERPAVRGADRQDPRAGARDTRGEQFADVLRRESGAAERHPAATTGPRERSTDTARTPDAEGAVAESTQDEQAAAATPAVAVVPAPQPQAAAADPVEVDAEQAAGVAGDVAGANPLAVNASAATAVAGGVTPEAAVVTAAAGTARAGGPTGTDPTGADPAVVGAAAAGVADTGGAQPMNGQAAQSSPADQAPVPAAVAGQSSSDPSGQQSTSGQQGQPGQSAQSVQQAQPVSQTQPAFAVPAPAAPPATPVAAAAPAPAATPHPPVAEQVVPRLASVKDLGDGVHRLTLRVQPEAIGSVRVVAEVRGDAVRLELHGGTEAAREALRAVLPDIKRDLAAVGLHGAQLDLGSADGGRHGWAGERTTGRPGERTGPASGGATAAAPEPPPRPHDGRLDVLA